jgi:hypothetical protein
MTPGHVHNEAKNTSRSFLLWLLVMTVLAGGFRLYHLGSASLWVDELNTVRVCADFGGTNMSKLLGYVPTAVGLWLCGANPFEIPVGAPELWRSMGVDEWSMRIASALIGIVSVPLLGLASRRLLGARVAGIMALLLAIAPWHIYWSQASRFYTQQFLFYNLSLLWYFSATEQTSRRRMVGAMVFMVLAFLSQPPALVICFVFALDWLAGLLRRRPVRLAPFGWICAVVALAVCAGVLALDVERKPEDWTQFVGDTHQVPWTMILGSAYMIGPAVILFALLPAWRRVVEGNRLSIYLLLAGVVPPLAFAIMSSQSYVGLRYAFVSLYAWLALAAIGIDQIHQVLRERLGRAVAAAPLAVLLASMLLMAYGYYTTGAGFHTRWRDAFDYVARHREPTDRVACARTLVGRYYLEDASVEKMPKTSDQLTASNHPTWIVMEAEDAIRERVRPWLNDVAELKAVFDVRVVAPYSSVRVYRYAPAGRSPTGP